MTDSGRQYPNLTTCKVVLQSTTSSLKPPVRLPQECLDVAENTVIPAPYDFALEKSILRTKQERDHDLTVVKADSRQELQNAVVVKMKAVTAADEDICIALLEQHNYDVTTSIEAFFQSSYQ